VTETPAALDASPKASGMKGRALLCDFRLMAKYL